MRLTPRGGADRVEGIFRDAAGNTRLAIRVRAAPEKGAANAALERLLATLLDVPRGAVTVTAGHAARAKTLRVAGDPESLAAAATALAESAGQAGAPFGPSARPFAGLD